MKPIKKVPENAKINTAKPAPAGPPTRIILGEKGDRGPRGVRGDTGAAGTHGMDGLDGSTGPVGPTGSTGQIGPIGSTGPIGKTGMNGRNGRDGRNGATGPTGPSGSPPEYETHAIKGIRWRNPDGSWGDWYAQNLSTANFGLRRVNTDATLTGDGTSSSPLSVSGTATGSVGATGASGADGVTGSTGVTGDVGVTGPQGDTGDTGIIGDTGPQGATGVPDYDLVLKLDQTTPQSVINGTPSFADIKFPDMSLGTPTYSTLNDFFKLFTSAGRLTGGTITDAGSETIDVAAGTGVIRIADDDVSQVKFFDWSASSAISVPTDTVKYIGIDYNVGAEVITIEARDSQNWDYDTEFPLGSVINISGILYILNDSWWVGDGLTNVIERFQSEGTVRDERIGGLIIGTSGTNTTRKPTITAGHVWARLNEFPIDAKDCSVADTFYGFYRDGAGGWTRTAAKTDIDDFYDNNSGTLQALNNNKFVNFWVFAEVDTANNGQLMLIYPQNQYNTSAEAEAEVVPVFPSIWYLHGVLAGRITIKQGVTTPVEIASSFSKMFSAALAADHGNLSGLQGGTASEYYHLTSTQYTSIILGPASATDNALVRFDGTTGKLVQDSVATLSDVGALSLAAGAAEGVTPELKIYGYRTGDSLRSLEIGVGVDAADTASFDGLSNYLFDGTLKAPTIQVSSGYASFTASAQTTTLTSTVTNTWQRLSVSGNGTGAAYVRAVSPGGKTVEMQASQTQARIDFTTTLQLGYDGNNSIQCFYGCAEGETPYFSISGHPIGGTKRTVYQRVGYKTDLYTDWMGVDGYIFGDQYGTDNIQLIPGNTPYIKWNDGELTLQTDEGTNTDTVLNVIGKGTGVGQVNADAYEVAGTQVVGAQGAAVADAANADATDLASAITLVNELKAQLNAALARVRAHGLIAT